MRILRLIVNWCVIIPFYVLKWPMLFIEAVIIFFAHIRENIQELNPIRFIKDRKPWLITGEFWPHTTPKQRRNAKNNQ
jgi:hypothetical protein